MSNPALIEWPDAGRQDTAATLITSTVTQAAGDDYVLANRARAHQAFGCVIQPCPGDLVLCAVIEGGREETCAILQILSRPDPSSACLTLPANRRLTVAARQVSLQGSESLRFSTLGDMDLCAGAGTLTVIAGHLFQTVSGTLVQQARHWLGKARDYALDIRGVLRQHGTHNLITAEKDVRIDGERINMG